MAVCDRHDFTAFSSASRTDSSAPFFGELKLASMKVSDRSSLPRAQVFGQRVQQPSQRAVALPLLKTAMAGLIGWIAVGQIVPRSTGAQNPENAVQHGTRIAPGPTSTIGASLWSKQGLELFPLRLGQVHAPDLRYFA